MSGVQGRMLDLMDFAGRWRLSRRITEAQGDESWLEGQAHFTPQGDTLAYLETGVLHVPDTAPLQAERRYLWRREGAQIAVQFPDGRLFHRFDPALSHPEAEHACAPDHYAVRYDLTVWPAWQTLWRVNGPRKAYTMVSCYRRAD